VSYQVAPHRLARNLPRPDTIFTKNDQRLEDFAVLNMLDNQRILHLVKNFDPDKVHFKVETDYLIVSNNSIDQLDQINATFTYKTLILDHTNHQKTVDLVQQAFENSDKELLNMNNFALTLDLRKENY